MTPRPLTPAPAWYGLVEPAGLDGYDPIVSRSIDDGRRARRRRQVGRPPAAVSAHRRERAIALVQATPAITRSQLARELDVDPDTARRIRRQLEEAGLVPEPPEREQLVAVELREQTADRAIGLTGATTLADALEQLVAERWELGPPAMTAAGRAAADQAAADAARRRGARR